MSFIFNVVPVWLLFDVNPCFDGHEAVLFWTEHYLEEYPDANFSDIQQQFIRSVLNF
jgi:hypothetical protein